MLRGYQADDPDEDTTSWRPEEHHQGQSDVGHHNHSVSYGRPRVHETARGRGHNRTCPVIGDYYV